VDNGARQDWERRVGRRSDPAVATATERPPPPEHVETEGGAGQVTIRWTHVEGAVGYCVLRDGVRVDHGSRDVLITPGPVYCDTTGERGREYEYTVTSVADVSADPGPASDGASAASRDAPASPLELRVDASRVSGRLERPWRMVGSEHLSQVFYGRGPGGSEIGREFGEALARAYSELGVELVRAHAILHDELGVVRDDGTFDFAGIFRVYDRVLELGVRPVVELSFMPKALAEDPEASVFQYRGLISPPDDWDRWAALNRELAQGLVARYGLDEVARWGFEVWNEPNLEVFWAGTQADYFRLYELSARSIKDVDERLVVGGPSTAAAGWILDFLDFVVEHDVPLDFVSTHTYGNLPVDVRSALRARGLEDVGVWWTEWGVTPTHFYDVTDSVYGAPFVLHGMKSAQGRIDALAYWVVSDHFEELGRAERLLHGGFGLLTIGNLRKPRWWALALAQQLGDDLLEAELTGDGAGSLVDAWAARRDDGTIDVLVWNGSLEQAKADGDPLLDRTIRINVAGLGSSEASLARIDHQHSNLAGRWDASRSWPSAEEWERLRAEDRLAEEALGVLDPVELELRLPQPGVARLRLRPRE